MNKRFYIFFLVFVYSISLSAKVIKEYFPNKKLKSIGNYELCKTKSQKKYIKSGKFKAYYLSGELAYELTYKDDKKDSKMIWYDKDGNIIEIMPYSMGKREGVEKRFYPNGSLKYTVKYINDKKEGEEKFFYQNGTLAEVSNYKNGKREGEKKEYYPDGKLYSKVLYINNYKEGKKLWFDKDGKINKIKEFKMDRPLEFYSNNKKDSYGNLIKLKGVDFNPNSKKIQ
ncbi:MAG: hypothetical protein DSZ06_02645 [Sulfurospirillum sp.]|nr:MAG: hypothetical protein DSZ06_02645 [Sulfurospirillum sp.]